MKLLTFFIIVLCFLPSCLVTEKNIRRSDDHHKIAIDLIGKCNNPLALSHLLKAIKLNPRDFLVRHTLATVYYTMGHYDNALVEFKKTVKQKPKVTDARVNLALVYIDLDQPHLALRELKIAEKDMTYNDYLKIINRKGLAYYKIGKQRLAKKWLKEALSLPKGESCFAYISLGRVEMAMGNFKKSEHYLKKALFFCSKEKSVCTAPSYEQHLALAQLYISKKDKKRAKYHLNIFLKKTKKQKLIKKAKKLLKKISLSSGEKQKSLN